MKKIVLILSLIFTFHQTQVFADTCDTETMKKLMKDANNIKISYETEEKTVENGAYLTDGGSPTIVITNILLVIYNISDNIIIVSNNDINNSKQTITYSDSNNGTYKLDTYDNYNKLGVYTFDIYVKDGTCKNEKLRTVDFKKPITNPYYLMDICKENLDIPLCTQFINEFPRYFNNTTIGEYIKQYRKTSTMFITSKESNNSDDKLINNINIKYYIGGFIIIFAITIFVIIKKKGRNM